MISQAVAVVIFLVMFGLIISEKIERHIVSLTCGILTITLVFGICMHSMNAMIRILNFEHIFTVDFWYEANAEAGKSTGINWATIIFITGMMIMVEGMANAGFFRWLCISIAKKVKYKVIPIFIIFMLLSAILSMFIDSITVILFLAAITIELAQMLKFNPIPMVLSEIFCANLGGSATMCGDPPNIILGTSLGLTFIDFFKNTGLMAGVSLIIVVIYFYLCFRKKLTQNEKEVSSAASFPEPSEVITDKRSFITSTIIFLTAVIMLITHAKTGLTVAFIGVFIAAVTLLAEGKNAWGLLKKVDYKTIFFFIGLFIVVGGLEETKILDVFSNILGKASNGNLNLLTAIIMWVSAVVSAFVDNIPFSATMIPVIENLSATENISVSILAWVLAMGTDIGGSATPIGASANVVGTAIAEKEGYHIGWFQYCLYLVPAAIIVLTVSMFFVWVRYL